jgi:hypothetical protein
MLTALLFLCAHSHPNFEPNPSLTDVKNHHNYQSWYASDNERPFPYYIAAIVGTLQPGNERAVRDPTTLHRFFHIKVSDCSSACCRVISLQAYTSFMQQFLYEFTLVTSSTGVRTAAAYKP